QAPPGDDRERVPEAAEAVGDRDREPDHRPAGAREAPAGHEEDVTDGVANAAQTLGDCCGDPSPGRLLHWPGLYRRALSASRPGLLRYEIDHERHALERVVLAHPVLQVISPVAGDQPPVIHLDRDARRPVP